MIKMVHCILIKVTSFLIWGRTMRNYITAAIVALVLGSASAAYAQSGGAGVGGTLVGGASNAGSVGGTLVGSASNTGSGTNNPIASSNPTSDISNGKADYRLSCPYLTTTPTVNGCRALTQTKLTSSPPPY